MRKVIFLSIMLSAFAVNAQTPPLSIRSYGYGQTDRDSFLIIQKQFTYGENGNLVQERIADYNEVRNTVVYRKYDGNNRIEFLVELDESEDTVRKEIWLYDGANKKIEHTIYKGKDEDGVLLPDRRTTFIGVNDMNEPEGGMTIEVFNFPLGIKYRNCATVITETFSETWSTLLTITPTYASGRITSASILPDIIDIGFPFTVSMRFTYNMQNKPSRIEFSLIPSDMPFPIPIAAIENTYENNLIVDSVMMIDLSPFGIPKTAYWYNFTYNNDRTIAFVSQKYTDNVDLDVWILIGRDWYDYHLNVPSYVKNELKLSPNPAKDKIQIITENDPISTVTIYDVVGKEVLTLSNINDYKTDIDIQNLNSGIYVVKIKTTYEILTRKIVKQ